ncbi:Uncharacterised protein [Escherichia coli]|uniref:Uncharacterized protein n=1 Tax=Escherichia coli TaxID=562 RepID=A0A376MWE5_ECOLX|nr:Uncharacterised protein [Escherichia coli]
MLPECWLKRTSTWPEVNDRPCLPGVNGIAVLPVTGMLVHRLVYAAIFRNDRL